MLRYGTHITDSCPFGIVKERDKIVSRMRHNSTENTSHITSSKTNAKLQRFAALVLWSGNGMLVDQLNNGLK